MKRRVPKDVRWAQRGVNGRPVKEIIRRWMSQEKRRTHKRERREGKSDTLKRAEEERNEG